MEPLKKYDAIFEALGFEDKGNSFVFNLPLHEAEELGAIPTLRLDTGPSCTLKSSTEAEVIGSDFLRSGIEILEYLKENGTIPIATTTDLSKGLVV